jgi:hypothetical protein
VSWPFAISVRRPDTDGPDVSLRLSVAGIDPTTNPPVPPNQVRLSRSMQPFNLYNGHRLPLEEGIRHDYDQGVVDHR